MPSIRTILLTCFIFLVSSAFQTTGSSRYNVLYSSLSKGETKSIYNHLSDIVYIQIYNRNGAYIGGAYSRKQAQIVLNKFYKTVKPKEFKLLYDRVVDETQKKYSIGNLYTSKGVYKTNIYINVGKNDYMIEQIKFERVR